MSAMAILIALICLGAGSGIGYFVRQNMAKKQVETAEGKIEKMVTDAQTSAKEIILEAKTKASGVIERAEGELKEQKDEARKAGDRILKREETMDKRFDEVERARKVLEEKAGEIRSAREEVEGLKDEQSQRLEKIAGLTHDQAKKALLQLAEERSRENLSERMVKLQKREQEEWEKEARNIMTQVIQKYSRSHAAEVMTSTLTIPNEEVKGKIIGKEGRNIRSLERATGVELIVDETPESVVISAFDPVRREIAKIALEKLIEDGRIHPAKIEEVVVWAEKEIDNRIREAGEAAAYEVGIAGLDPKLLYILGRLRYRTSFKQNVLLHSLEVSYLAGAIASEIGGDVKTAKMAGLFHDIGKAVDHEVQGTHVEIGIKILQKFGIDDKVVLGMRSHHDEYPYAIPEAYIVTAADALSSARPGARKDTVENYIKRLEELEMAVNSFPAVTKSYAIQAGREVRIFVNPEKTDDYGAQKLAQEVAAKVEEELKYPGEIKIVVLRETRAIEYAR